MDVVRQLAAEGLEGPPGAVARQRPGLAVPAQVATVVQPAGEYLGGKGRPGRGADRQRGLGKVAHVLAVTPVQPIDAETRALAPTADVVVIAGADRANP